VPSLVASQIVVILIRSPCSSQANKKTPRACQAIGVTQFAVRTNPAFRPYGLPVASVSKGSVSRESRVIVKLGFFGKGAFQHRYSEFSRVLRAGQAWLAAMFPGAMRSASVGLTNWCEWTEEAPKGSAPAFFRQSKRQRDATAMQGVR
jgi:hypothetical protein